MGIFQKGVYKMKNRQKEIKNILCALGIPCTRRGYYYTLSAVDMLIENPLDYIGAFSLKLYPVIAKKYNTTITAIDHSIRRIVELVAKNDTDLFRKIWNSNESPTPTKFLLLLVEYINEKDD